MEEERNIRKPMSESLNRAESWHRMKVIIVQKQKETQDPTETTAIDPITRTISLEM